MTAADGSVPGSCPCGGVRFTVDRPPKWVAHCHCNNCRRAHGAPFVTWAGFSGDQVRVEEGRELLHRWVTDTGATRTSCSRCGGPLFFEAPRWPGEIHVALAQILEPLGTPPQAHAYADRAPDWAPILDDLPRYGGESGTEPLG